MGTVVGSSTNLNNMVTLNRYSNTNLSNSNTNLLNSNSNLNSLNHVSGGAGSMSNLLLTAGNLSTNNLIANYPNYLGYS